MNVHGGSGAVAGERGTSYVELMFVIALASVVAVISVPLTANTIDATRAWHATTFVAARFRMARIQAVQQTRSVGLVFDLAGPRWVFRICVDGNGNGLRRADIASGHDTCPQGPFDLGADFRGAEIAVDPALRGPDGEPGSPDPVRFGRSNIASFSSEGSCTAGTLFVRSAKGVQYAVRVGNVSGRTRMLRYDPATRKWVSA